MKNLLELAKATANEVLTTTSKRESVNDAIVAILYDGKQQLTRQEIIFHVAARRMEQKYGNDLNKQKDADLQKEMKKTIITVKNGVDQSFAKGQNNASFAFNPKFSEYSLQAVKGTDKYEVVKVKS